MTWRIETDRLLLRPLVPGDLDGFLPVVNDPMSMRFYPKPFDREMARVWIERVGERYERDGYGLLAVVERETGEMVGVCGVVHVDGTGPDVELVYEFQRSAWGQGYATEAARACLAAALGPLGLKRVVALAYPENAQSIRIMQKLGMRDTGMIDAYGHQLVCYEALAGDE